MSNERTCMSIAPVEASRRIREMSVLVVAGTANRQAELGRVIERLGCQVTTADFLQLESLPIESKTFQLVVVDVERDLSPLGGTLARIEPQKVIALIPEGMREQGAWVMGMTFGRYVLKPVHPEELLQAVRDRLELVALQETATRLSDELRARYRIENIIGISRGAEMRRTFVRTFAGMRHPLFLSGERGVGKQMLAQTVHYSSPWAMAPFVLVDTAHVPASAISGLLFGDSGWIEGEVEPIGRGVTSLLGAGTVYITEASLVPLPLQYRLAAFLHEQQAAEAEGAASGPRFIFGSQWTPEQLRRKGLLVEDLYQLVREAHLGIEPLRARPEDIPYFVDYFVERICQRQQKEKRTLTDEALQALVRYAWPENVDELQRVLEVAVRRTVPPPIDIAHLPEPIGRPAPRVPKVPFPEEGIDFYELVEEFERGLIVEALRRTGGNQRRAARLLRLRETTLAAMRRRLNIAPDRV
ncbi:MAG: sigma 54-interacting transcriptional regulator [Blastocatellia bacterium]|nr:sigma 54-interacting transcriptional regulator [Blastocatellia bacterium]MCS7156569.1 sigma 54-interacting transcriptional regulator [Blastocatellia bacterium]MCX7751690.1 sigma 54-interacting transcriptional regulator [Blastocatellia bacterium]MDW8168791.1 sigma 54-interacting transcriptional regulator [Acidobacteriota bacterium]MDW8255670.1 sigma 54-interacting transcriptional regulator [Acidobacteriota bacterium]